MTTLTTNNQRWLPLVVLFSCYSLFLVIQWPIVSNIWQYSFDDGTYSHAFLVPIVSGYLYYELWQQNKLQLASKISWFWLLLAFAFSFILVILTLAQIPFLFRLTWLALITCITLVLFKPSFAVAFPAAFLIFLLPIWNGLTAILQPLAVAVVTKIMSFTHIPTFVEGNLIYIPDGVFEIAGGCSGVRYFLVAMAISSLFVFLNIRRSKHAITIIGIAFFGALITNWIRITALIVIGHQTQMQSSLMQDHNNFGWVLFIPFMMFLFYIGNKLALKEQSENHKQISNTVNDTPKKMNKIALLLPIIVLLFSGSYNIISNNTNQSEISIKHCDKIPANFPQPKIYNYSANCAQLLSNKTLSMQFEFDGSNLDSKADFYQHQYLPTNSKVMTHDRTSNSSIYIVSWQEHRYWLGITRIVNKKAYGSKLNYILARIKAAFNMSNRSSIKWVVHRCDSKCNMEQRSALEQLLVEN